MSLSHVTIPVQSKATVTLGILGMAPVGAAPPVAAPETPGVGIFGEAKARRLKAIALSCL